MTLYHVANDVSTFVGACFNSLIPPGEVIWRFKALLKTASWVVKQSADGSLWSASDILLNASNNNNTGAPNFYQLGMNLSYIVNSINNYNAYYVVETPVGTPAKFKGQFCIQHVEAYANGNYSIFLRVKFSKGGFANGTATAAPAPLVAGDERVIAGVHTGSTDAAPVAYYTWVNQLASATEVRFNMGVNDDPNNPFFWLEGHKDGVADPDMFAMWDSLDDLGYDAAGNPLDNGAVCHFTSNGAFYGGSAAFLGKYDIAELDAGTFTGHGLGGSCGDGAQAVCAYIPSVYKTGQYVPLIYERTNAVGGLGYDSLDSSLESVLPIHYCVPGNSSVDRKSGYIGRSKNFLWATGEPMRAHLSMGDPGGGVAYALCNNVWVPVNNGASPGLNNVALIV